MASFRKDQDIVIQITKEFKGTDISNLDIKKLVKAVCNRFGRHEQTETRYEISIVIVGDDKIREFNRNFLNNKASTDCISFDLSEDEKEGPKTFDLIINGEMAVRQANLRGHSSQAELALYIAHGLLHNLGFDDFTKSRARKMHETEDEILWELGYGPVYNKSTNRKNISSHGT